MHCPHSITILALQTGEGDPFNDLALENKEDDEQRHGGQAGAGHDLFPFGGGFAAAMCGQK
jgi:hypothetical protein